MVQKKRKRWDLLTLWLAAVLISSALCSTTVAEEPSRQLNVLFLSVDDMNDWIGCLGGYAGQVHTPNIDRLARRGMLFTNAHCASPVCNPSRTAVLTGLNPSSSGIYHNGQWWRPALPERVTLPEHFHAQGYRVAGGGKVFHHMPGFNPPGLWNEYFDQVFDDPHHRPQAGEIQSKKGTRWPSGFPLSGLDKIKDVQQAVNAREFDWGPFDKPDLGMGDGRMVEWAVEFLKRKHDKPFFLAAGIFRPHLPWYAPRKYFEQYPLDEIVLPKVKADDINDLPETGKRFAAARHQDLNLIRHAGQYKQAIQAYLASISFADALVGRLTDALEESRYARNTIIVLWSDHGWHLGEKGHWHKMTLWEEATRVPLIVIAPGITQPNSRSSRPVSLVDLYPTLIELCGLPKRNDLDGRSLVPLLKNPQSFWNHPVLITYRRGNHALRSERYRYIRYADGGEELYDHQHDPHEWANLVGDSRFNAVKQNLSQHLPQRNAPNAAVKNAYRFDFEHYRWARRKKEDKKP